MAAIFKRVRERLRALLGSLRVALMVTVLVGIAVPASITVYLERMRLQDKVTRQLQADLRKTSELFANGVKDAVWQMSKPDADVIAAAAFADERIVSIEIRDKDDAPFTSQQRSGAVPSATQRYTTEMKVSDKVIGRVTVTMDEESIHRQMNDMMEMSLRLVGQSLLGALILIGLTLHLRLIKPVQRLVRATTTLANGDLDSPIQSHRTDEIGQLARSMDTTRLALLGQINRISEVAEISGELQKAQSIAELGATLLNWLGPRLGVGQAGLYVANEEAQCLTLAYTFARPRNNALPQTLQYGEGLLGQTGFEKKVVLINQPTPAHVQIESGLGMTTPRAIVIQPIKMHEALLGVMEMALLEPYTPEKQALVERLLPIFALCMEILNRNSNSPTATSCQ